MAVLANGVHGERRVVVTGPSSRRHGSARFAATLAADLERRRLEAGIDRAERALRALHQLADDRRRQVGSTPRQIARAIVDFEAQVLAARARLAEIAGVEDR